MQNGRYDQNREAFSEAELELIRTKRVCVVGCGGLGGFVGNALARFGVGALTLVDGDDFAAGNLNRQLFATEETLGRNKAEVCKERLAQVNSEVLAEAVCDMLDDANAGAVLRGHHLAVDCLDNPQGRLLLGRHCARLGIPLVHGAAGGFFGQVANVFPGDGLLETLYAGWKPGEKGVEKSQGNPVFTVQAVAALQVCEALKLLAGHENALRGKLLYIDLERGTMETVCV